MAEKWHADAGTRGVENMSIAELHQHIAASNPVSPSLSYGACKAELEQRAAERSARTQKVQLWITGLAATAAWGSAVAAIAIAGRAYLA
jgi:hypothetical protein